MGQGGIAFAMEGNTKRVGRRQTGVRVGPLLRECGGLRTRRGARKDRLLDGVLTALWLYLASSEGNTCDQ